ncbi:hypothetical protein L6Q21_01500 [Sandaracinobacter sp. RS1-74]|uniref:hypothetical protein n=1 Tax=Sandaracinobacteroides sayramensis TaxID=2913411 RepID=UPI001EDA26C9|nr:hypothetical protein [Sandaracinobacteroides sayramensis]MCG2839654.1 hypothetical protein [Sandaracinobacteroides sayramensis]
MIGKLVSAVAGRSVAQTVGGTAAGPVGAVIGAALPVMLPAVARRLGPAGMVAAAVGGLLFTRWLERRNARKQAEAAAPGAVPPRQPEAVLGGPIPPDALEGELLKD